MKALINGNGNTSRRHSRDTTHVTRHTGRGLLDRPLISVSQEALRSSKKYSTSEVPRKREERERERTEGEREEGNKREREKKEGNEREYMYSCTL